MDRGCYYVCRINIAAPISGASIEAMGSGANLGEPLAAKINYRHTQVVILGTADASRVYGQ